jgi:hypothetical protein
MKVPIAAQAPSFAPIGNEVPPVRSHHGVNPSPERRPCFGGRSSSLGGRRSVTLTSPVHVRSSPKEKAMGAVAEKVGHVFICSANQCHNMFQAKLSHGEGRLTPKGTVRIHVKGIDGFSEKPVSGSHILVRITTAEGKVTFSLRKDPEGTTCGCQKPFPSEMPQSLFMPSSFYL